MDLRTQIYQYHWCEAVKFIPTCSLRTQIGKFTFPILSVWLDIKVMVRKNRQETKIFYGLTLRRSLSSEETSLEALG